MNTLALTLVAAMAAATDPSFTTASHAAEILRDEVVWNSTYVFQSGHTAGEARLDLAWPLPRDARVVTRGTPIDLVTDASGRTVAFRIPRDRLVPRRSRGRGTVHELRIAVHEPTPGDGAVTLHPPFAAGSAVQRVTLSSAEAVRFVPDGVLDVERRIGFTTGADVDRDDRRAVESMLGTTPGSLGGELLYLRPQTAAISAGGLAGHLELAPAKRKELALATAGIFGGLLLLGFVLYRRLAGAAELEQAEAIIDADYRGLDVDSA